MLKIEISYTNGRYTRLITPDLNPQILAMGRPDAAYAIAIELCRHIPLMINRDDLQPYIQKYTTWIRKMIVGSFTALVTSAKTWNNEEKRRYVCNFIFEQSKQYREYRGLQKILIQLMPSRAFPGGPVTVVREMNDEEQYHARLIEQRKAEEQRQRLEAEKEAKSLIPLSQEYERDIFDRKFINMDCDLIASSIYDENKRIKNLAERGNHKDAALKFLQLTNSMCRHFIQDSHYNYFDEIYSTEYAIDELIEYFNDLIASGILPLDITNYLSEAWKEIKDTECYRDYYIPQSSITTRT